MATPRVLLVTHSRDVFTIDRVRDPLVAAGAEAVRLDTDRFPLDAGLSVRIGARADDGSWDAVWLRKVWPSELLEIDPEFRPAVQREVQAFWRLFLGRISASRWINDPVATFGAENKGRQLALARDLGLAIPDTLVTNRPDEARTFFAAHGGRVVAKMLTPLQTSLDGDAPFVYTRAVETADLADDDALRSCPTVFQERIAKSIELRVIVVGADVHVAGIRPPDGAAEVDWRTYGPAARWEEAGIDAMTRDRLVRLVRALGLTFAAIDLVRRPDGTEVFLEANPSGEWGMLERDLGLPIGASLARALLTPVDDGPPAEVR